MPWKRFGSLALALWMSFPLGLGLLPAEDPEPSFECGDFVEDGEDLPTTVDCNDHEGKAWCEAYADPCVPVNSCQSGDSFQCGVRSDGTKIFCSAAKFSTASGIGYCHPCPPVLFGETSERDCGDREEECSRCECVICATGTAYRNSSTCARDNESDRIGFAYKYDSGCLPPEPEDPEEEDPEEASSVSRGSLYSANCTNWTIDHGIY